MAWTGRHRIKKTRTKAFIDAWCLQCVGAGGDTPDHPASLHPLLIQRVRPVSHHKARRLAILSGHAAWSNML